MKFAGIFIALLLIGSSTPSSFAQSTTTSSSEVVYLSQEENQFYILLNQFRTRLGLPSVKVHVYLQSAAKKHSLWMASQQFLSHWGGETKTSPYQRMNEAGYVNYTSMGENVACGNGDAVKTFRQWALSPGHLANMINPHFRHIGISREGTGNERCPYYWTNDFASMTNPNLDPSPIEDLQAITHAFEELTGPLLDDETIALPGEENEENPRPASTPKPSPTPASRDFTLIECMIPYSAGRNIISFTANTDAVIDITRGVNGYQLKASYLQDGVTANLYPLVLSHLSVVKNSTYPLITIFSAPNNRAGGFTIQYDTKSNTAQFDAFPSTGSSTSILCTMK